MVHQAEEERQVGLVDALLVDGQDELTLLGVQQIVGVLDALGDALVGQQLADVVAGDEVSQLVVGNFGVDGHGVRVSGGRQGRVAAVEFRFIS